jgi:hypothetical protein
MNPIKTFLLLISVLLSAYVNAQPPGQWMWIHGDGMLNPLPGNFGVMGVPSPANKPPTFKLGAQWSDLNGNFWQFGGGDNYWNRAMLWKYEPAINQWTWMKGDSAVHTPGHYGIKGVPDAANFPPGRQDGEACWTDLQGNLWLYGGLHSGVGGGVMSDVWKYDVLTNEWTWMHGDSTGGHPPVYGIQGMPDINNTPGGRRAMAAWTGNDGNLWLFGGETGNRVRGDLWRYNIATNMWTWMKGSATNVGPVPDPGHYGVRGTENNLNMPPARKCWSRWKDLNGNFWLFAGQPWNGDYSYNDMWRYNPITNNWTWMHGDTVINSLGLYDHPCVTSAYLVPASRTQNQACITDENGNFWMYGGWNEATGCQIWADLWMYCVSSNEWTLKNGSDQYISTYWGSLNVPSSSNRPGGRYGHNAWYDNAGHIYIFGGGGFNDLWRFTINNSCGGFCKPLAGSTSIDENEKQRTRVYPNPTNSSFTVESITDNLLQTISILSVEGRKLKSIINHNSSIITIDVSDLAAGIYFLVCTGQEGREMVKVVKY